MLCNSVQQPLATRGTPAGASAQEAEAGQYVSGQTIVSGLEWPRAVLLVSAVVMGVKPRAFHMLDVPAPEIPLALGSLGGWNNIL